MIIATSGAMIARNENGAAVGAWAPVTVVAMHKNPFSGNRRVMTISRRSVSYGWGAS
jgi:hypothetical protein